MRNSKPLQWIEDAEATQVMAAALFEKPASRSWRERAGNAVADWFVRASLRLWPRVSAGWPPWQAQPALVRHPHRRRVRPSNDG